ncbi:alpha/beta fold hydrolase [Streptomyces sp. NPDC054933]
MPEIELGAGVIDYTDTGGDGEVVVLVHGLGFDESVWTEVANALRGEFRVLSPVLPIGSHRRPMRPDADLSAHGVAAVLAEFLERLDVRDVTLVQNDAGTAQLLVGVRDERIGRLGLVSWDGSAASRWADGRTASLNSLSAPSTSSFHWSDPLNGVGQERNQDPPHLYQPGRDRINAQ